MQTPFLYDEQIYLRPLQRSDINDAYLGWLNDPEIASYLDSGIFPTTRDDLARFYDGTVGNPNQVTLAIVVHSCHSHIGNVKLGPINWVYRKATFGILIGDKSWWNKGVGTRATRLMVEYGFFRLNLNRIDLGVYAEHEAAIKIYQRIGFQMEGQFREDMFHAGRFKDRVWMGLLRSEYTSTLSD